MEIVKTCGACEQLFTARSLATKYCSTVCANMGRTVYTPEQVKAYLLKYAHIPDDPDACWDWYGYVTDKGRPLACIKNQKLYASHVSYETFVEPLPEGMYLLHSCDNPRCINFRHLHPGTKRDNNAERTSRKRTARGSNHYRSRLNELEVRDILRLFHDEHLSQQNLAKRFNVSFVTIHNVVYREAWGHVLPGQYPPPQDTRKSVTEADVHEMRTLYNNGTSANILAQRFGITPSHAWRICVGKAWAHIP